MVVSGQFTLIIAVARERFFNRVVKRGVRVTQPFPAGCGGAVSPPAGSGAEPLRQTHFGNNRLKII